MDTNHIRNFCIIAHIDHGKSTLADRFLELTGTISEREKKDQLLDSMDLERERGITIKMQPVTMEYESHMLNLIDTPGHVDFTYEVSRALAAVEGAILVVDATQGIQAQTLANLYLAMEQDLTIIPVLNKIDLKGADVEGVTQEVSGLLGVDPETIIPISAKTGENVEAVLAAVIERIPPPKGTKDTTTKALIFDSFYDTHRGVMCDVRIVQGNINKGDTIYFHQTKTEVTVRDIGVYTPKEKSQESLQEGAIGYIVTGIREVQKCQVGDTIMQAQNEKRKAKSTEPLPGYKEVKPVVFANMYAEDQGKYLDLRKALEELHLNDAALYYEPTSSPALGKGFKVGVLGLLHLDIVQERILREFNVAIVLTVPQVEYTIHFKDTRVETITSPQEFPDNPSIVEHSEEPWVDLEIITTDEYMGDSMQLVIERRGEYVTTEYLHIRDNTSKRAIVKFKLPLAELLTDFYDKLKSVSSGYASMNYEIGDSRNVDLVKVGFLVSGEETESLTMLVPRAESDQRARRVLATLKNEIPPHMFDIRLQAQIGGKIIASERIRAKRKDVTAKLYGGDVTRKQKLLKKQKKGKAKMEAVGNVVIPNRAYLAVLKR